jgi:hypothetical protein
MTTRVHLAQRLIINGVVPSLPHMTSFLAQGQIVPFFYFTHHKFHVASLSAVCIHNKCFLPRYLSTNCRLEAESSGESNSCPVTPEIPYPLWNPKLHYRPQNNRPLVPILSQICSFRTIRLYFVTFRFNTVSSTGSFKLISSLKVFQSKPFICFS